MTDVQTPQFAFPLRLDGDSFAVVEQDSADDVRACVEVIVRYPQGLRLELPDFGTPDQTFKQGAEIDTAVILAAVARWEPRAVTLAAELAITPDLLIRQITLQVETGGAG